MKPDPQAVLGHLTGLLLQSIAPRVQPPYLAGTIAMSGSLLSIITEEWDGAAARLVAENRAIRALFRQAEALGLEGALASELRALAGGDDEDLRISALDAANGDLRAALTRLQAAVEMRPDGAAQALNVAIWAELAASTERRKLGSSPF